MRVSPEVRHYAGDAHAGALLEKAHAVDEQRRVTAELVDHERRHAGALGRLQQLQRADHRRQGAAALDVGDQDHRRLGALGDPHVDEVAGLEVHLGGRAGALDDHEIVARAQAIERGADHLAQLELAPVIVGEVHRPDRLAHDHDLRRRRAFGLEQDRVHVDVRHRARRLRLRVLRAVRSRRRRA